MRSIREIKDLKGKTVLLRVDFNVPIKAGKVIDDFRIKKTLPTIKFLLKKGAQIIILMHLGKDGTADLTPVIKHFFKISKLSEKKIHFFENIRKFPGEMSNNLSFSKKLAEIGDLYVNDAFSVSHRTQASVVGLPKHLPSYAGFLLEKEVKKLSEIFKNPEHPFLFILGGAKFSTKIPLIKKYLALADYVFIGGALANDLLKARGLEVGKSLVSDKNYNLKSILKNKKLILPEDVVVKSGKKFLNKKVSEVKKNEIILDVGKESVKKLLSLIQRPRLLVWNGPLGKYEEKRGEKATKFLLKEVAKVKGKKMIGGGDLVSLVSEAKLQNKFTFVSTGGGATLEFLEKKTLPGIRALE